MDKITHEVRLSQLKAIIEQCQAVRKGYKSKKSYAYPGCPQLTYGRYYGKHQKEKDTQ